MGNADAIYISTPEYGYGVPGVLKNALDRVVSSGELNHKPVALANAALDASRGEECRVSLLKTLSAIMARVIIAFIEIMHA